MIKLSTKVEICMLTYYEDMKGDKNTEIGVVWGLGVTQRHWQQSHSMEHI